jgi:hypothetical protein
VRVRRWATRNESQYERILKDQRELQKALENSRERVGVAADDLKRAVGAAP